VCRHLDANATLDDINRAIADCNGTGGVVELAAGAYAFSGQILFDHVSDVTLRGAGPDATRLGFSGSPSGANVLVQGPNAYDAITAGRYDGIADWVDGYTQGAAEITLSQVSGMATGDILVLDQRNDDDDVDARGTDGTSTAAGRENGQRSQQQWTEVQAISGNRVKISPAVYMPNWRSSQAPQAFWLHGYPKRVGIEDLRIDGSASSPTNPYSANIMWAAAWSCWVKNVVSEFPSKSHINPYSGGRNEVRHSTLHGTQHNDRESVGIVPIFESADLYEDNIFDDVTGPIVLDYGVAGGVVGYNFFIGQHFGDAPSWLLGLGGAAGAHVNTMLFEGNHAPQLASDFDHGSNGYNVAFRNRLTGWTATQTGGNDYAFVLQAKNRHWSAVGNLLGTRGYQVAYEAPDGVTATGNAVFSLGWASGATQSDSATLSTLFRHGNWDSIHDAIVWDANTTNHDLPASLYRATKPAWFGDRPWPPFDPTSPDATDPNNLPAGYRYANHGSDPPGAVN
jgi:hypothetical protein